jgi:opacity protein-like surface antigen
MKRVMCASLMTAALLWAGSASAQTMAGAPQAPQPMTTATTPSVNVWYVGAVSGVGVVQNTGAIAGIEGGLRGQKGFDYIVEWGWVQDAVTRRRLGDANVVATYLQTTQGKPATASVEAPTIYGLGGVRWVWERNSRLRPYFLAEGGVARVEFKPTFTLDGSDITSSVASYGVTVGDDLAGIVTKPAFGGGMGVMVLQGRWYADAGYRVISIGTESQRTNISRLHVGLGYRF